MLVARTCCRELLLYTTAYLSDWSLVRLQPQDVPQLRQSIDNVAMRCQRHPLKSGVEGPIRGLPMRLYNSHTAQFRSTPNL